jgi:two-component system, chemotaxis family, CheB/CheR fusion protein
MNPLTGRALILLAIEDITERKRAGERERILIAELRHRVKNMLTIVQSLFVQTALYSPSVERLRDTFLGRLHALARTHDHLMRREWRGMDLRELVEHELAPYRRAPLLDLNGPRVRLGERESTALTMTLHELATNAAKYGALSVPEGRVSVRWEMTDGEGGRGVHLRWRERDGPPVRAPSGGGFGTSLIERSITYELGGKASLNFATAGLECDIRFPHDG